MRSRLLVILVLLAHSAAADEPPTASEQPPATTVDPDTEVARRHFEAGRQLYDDYKYEAAIVEFKAANEAKPRPEFDFNIARCYDRLGDWANTLEYYRRYLAGAGNLSLSGMDMTCGHTIGASR